MSAACGALISAWAIQDLRSVYLQAVWKVRKKRTCRPEWLAATGVYLQRECGKYW